MLLHIIIDWNTAECSYAKIEYWKLWIKIYSHIHNKLERKVTMILKKSEDKNIQTCTLAKRTSYKSAQQSNFSFVNFFLIFR